MLLFHPDWFLPFWYRLMVVLETRQNGCRRSVVVFAFSIFGSVRWIKLTSSVVVAQLFVVNV